MNVSVRVVGGILFVIGVGFVRIGPAHAARGSPAPHAREAAAKPPVKPTVIHFVKRGETLYSIARAYRVPLQQITSANGIEDPSRISAGMGLRIPGARPLARPPRARLAKRSAPKAPPKAAPIARAHLTAPLPWPVEGPVISAFMKPRRGHRHTGIDIKSEGGAPVRAVADGIVTMAEESHGNYGRLVVIEHENGMVSYYGHNRRNLVAPGQRVTAEDVIALVGRSGNATCDHLHFELHAGGQPIDPIPALAAASAARPPAQAPVTASSRTKGPPEAGTQR